MIRSRDALMQVLCAGRTVSEQGLFAGEGRRLATSDTGETVFRSALRRLIQAGRAQVVANDLVGDPIEWGWVDEPS